MTSDTIWYERKVSNHALPLLRRIRGALSPFHSASSSLRSNAINLLDLPYELREKIFLYVLARHPLVHIIRHKGPPRRLRAVCCQDLDPFGKPPSLHHCWTEHLYYVNHKNFPCVFGDPKEEGKVTGEGNVGFLGLLLACRQIYSEGIQLLFSNNVFDLLHIDALSLLANPAYLPASHFHHIRHLRLSLHPSADFYHSQPRQPLSTDELQAIFAPMSGTSDVPSLSTSNHDPSTTTSPFRYCDWVLVWDIIPRMQSLSTIELRLNALCGPACDFPSKCNLLRPLLKIVWREAKCGLNLPALNQFDVVVKWNERRFHDILTSLVEECNAWMMATERYTVNKLPFRLLAEERLAWGCTVPWAT